MTITLPLTAPQIAARASLAAADAGHALALTLIDYGVPVIVLTAGRQTPVNKDNEWDRTAISGWQFFEADLKHLRKWTRNHGLALITGHGLDGIDVDTKHGASVDAERARLLSHGVHVLAETRTPSGGAHFYVHSSGNATTNGGQVSKGGTGIDTRMGLPDGESRGLLYLPGTRRPFYGGLGYTWVQPLDLLEWQAHTRDLPFMDRQRAAITAYVTEIGALRTGGTVHGAAVAPEPISAMLLPQWLQEELQSTQWRGKTETGEGDRSERFFHLVCACERAHLTQGQALTLLTEWDAHPALGRGKYGERVPEQVAKCWALAVPANDAWHARKAATATSSSGDVPRTSLTSGSLEDVQGPAQDDVAPAPSTWLPVDLGSILDGTYVPELPTIARRSDGLGLFYPGRTHSIYGPSESGKSLVAQAVAVEVLQDGGTVLYLDFESDGASIVQRLRSLGATDSAIRERLAYVRPDSGLVGMHWAAYQDVLSQTFTLAIIDGVTEAMALVRSDSHGTPEADASTFDRRLPRLIATRTGAAVIAIDHVVKDTVAQGRHAIGSVHKLNALTGAAFRAQATTLPGKGRKGAVDLQVTKDRPGSLRPTCGPMGQHQSQLAATFHFDATGEDGQTTVRVEAPSAEGEPRGPFRPTVLMERASRHLEDATGPVSRVVILSDIGGKRDYGIAALDVLVTEGYVHRERRGQALLHTSIRAYRQVEDALSDCYVHPGTGQPEL